MENKEQRIEPIQPPRDPVVPAEAGALKEAEYHDLIARLWSLVDPDDDEGGVLMQRVHAVLGVNEPNGHCGNAICAELAESERQRADLYEALKALVEAVRLDITDEQHEALERARQVLVQVEGP